MPSKTIVDFANQIKDYMRGAEVVEGKNHAYSQENNAVIATIENGKSYKVRWTGSATVTLKKNSASGTEVTNGSTSPLSFTADSDFDLYFGSSADVTEIMVYDGASTSDTYEPYYVPVKDSKFDIADQQVLGAWNLLKYPYYDTTKSVSGLDYTDLGDGRVEADGTSTVSNNDFTCFSRGIMNYELEAGTYYVSGCPEGGSESTYHLRISKNKVYNNPSQGFDDLGIDTGDGFSFTLTEKSQLSVVIRIGQTSINHLIFKPMISLEPNQPYVPYAMTNRELTEVKIDNTYASKNIYLTKSGNIKQMICLAATVENIKTVTLKKDFYPINDQDQLYPVLARTTGGIYYFAGLNYVASTHSFNANHPYSPNYGQYRDFMPDTMQVFSTIIWI